MTATAATAEVTQIRSSPSQSQVARRSTRLTVCHIDRRLAIALPYFQLRHYIFPQLYP